MITPLGRALGVVALAAAVAGCAATNTATTTSGAGRPTATVATTQGAVPARVPAPTTAAGYARMFAALDPAEWGAADVAISVPLRDGRSVWLFGDTLSTHRFVHSTAVTQDGGRLSVSHHGAQLLPDDTPASIYWIESANRECGSQVLVRARNIVLTGRRAWAFRDGGFSKIALVVVTRGGDVDFVRWTKTIYGPAADPGPMYRLDDRPHHFGYARHTHPEANLASGRTLVTTCQNWDDGLPHPLAHYQPIFSEQGSAPTAPPL